MAIKLMDRLASMFNKVLGLKTSTLSQSSIGNVVISGDGNIPNAAGFSVKSPWYDRVYQDFIQPVAYYNYCKEIDRALKLDPQLKSALKFFCYSSASGFRGYNVISAPNKARITKIINDLIFRTKMKTQIREWVYRLGKYGNHYLENPLEKIPSVTGIEKYRVSSLIYCPPETIIRNSDERNQFYDLTCAFEQHDTDINLFRSSRWSNEKKYKSIDYITFPYWKIKHFKIHALDSERYGESLIDSTIYSGIWHRSVEMSVELFYARLFDTTTDVHKLIKDNDLIDATMVDGKLNPKFQQYIESVSKVRRRVNGQPPARDLFLEENVSIERLQKTNTGSNIDDLLLINAMKLQETRTSPAMLGTSVNAGDVGLFVEQMRQSFIGQEDFFQDGMEGTLKELIDLELICNGVVPSDVEIEAIVEHKRLIQDETKVQEIANSMLDKGAMSRETRIKVGSHLFHYNPEEELAKVNKEKQESQKLIDKNLINDTNKNSKPETTISSGMQEDENNTNSNLIRND